MARTEYATLPEFKAFVTMDSAVIDRDTLLTTALDAAHAQVDRICGRRFDLAASATARTYRVIDHVVKAEDGELLLIDDAGATPTLVEMGGSTFTTVTSTIEYDPENAITRGRPIRGLRLYGGAWSSSPLSRVRVTARWGWPTVPHEVKEATLLQASRLYARRKSPQGVVGTAEWGEVRLSKQDQDVAALLGPFVRPGFGGGA